MISPILLSTLQLDGVEVALWQCDLSASVSDEVLSLDERARAARLVIPDKQRRFIAARVGLRLILGTVTQANPGAIVFGYGTDGKPYLPNLPWCEFNLTHSSDVALVAISHRPVGVDIEQERPVPMLKEMMGIAFSAQEQAELIALPVEQQVSAFFRTWTRKEALMKAHGAGFKLAKSYSFPVNTNLETRYLDGWAIHDLDLPDGIIGAVAVSMHFT
jgi:4'-phosphopantetheinyl transferase